MTSLARHACAATVFVPPEQITDAQLHLTNTLLEMAGAETIHRIDFLTGEPPMPDGTVRVFARGWMNKPPLHMGYEDEVAS